MSIRPLPLALAALALTAGCRRAPDTSIADPQPERARPTSESANAEARYDAAIELHPAVPATATGVLVVRSPQTIFDLVAALELFGPRPPDDDAAFRASLDNYLGRRLGVTLTQTQAVTVFLMANPIAIGVVFEGFGGQLSTPQLSSDPPIHEFDATSDLYATTRGSDLMIGNPSALDAMLATLEGQRPALAGSDATIAQLIAEHSTHAGIAFAIQAEHTPIGEELPEEFGVEHLYLDLSEQRVRALAIGEGRGLRSLALEIDNELRSVVEDLAEERTWAIRDNDPFEVLATMTAEYGAKRVAVLLTPQTEGDRLWIDVPLSVPELSTMLSAAGLTSLLVVREFARIGRRDKTSEAKTELAKLYDATSSYFKAERRTRAGDALPHACPNDGRAKGESGITPPLALNCNEGPKGHCVPGSGGRTQDPGHYDIALWTQSPIWAALNYRHDEPHRFHYNFIWDNDSSDGYGTCMFTVQAFADLDDDGIYSTFERSGQGDREGMAAAFGLFVDQELE